jgi:dynein heavy chain 2
MRGIGWQDSHWAQLFALLGFKSGVLSKESVTLSHFLDKCDTVVANAEAIKSMDATVCLKRQPMALSCDQQCVH